jgi:hypothetical protein
VIRRQHLLFGAVEQNPAMPEEDDPVDFREDFLDVVGDQDDGFAAPGQVLEGGSICPYPLEFL